MNKTDLKHLGSRHVNLSDVYDVDPKSLVKHPDNDRLFGKFKTEAQLSELGESIRKYGILEPVIICADGKTILSGHSRALLARLHHMKTIKARRVESAHTEEEILEILAVLNLHRMNLSKNDRIALYKEIYPDLEERLTMPGARICTGEAGSVGLNSKVIAKKLGLDERTVKEDLHTVRKAETFRKRQKDSWQADRIRGINKNAIIAVKSYSRKIDEWVITSNEQTTEAILEIVAELNRSLKKRTKTSA